jgi:hypothetical protein
MRELWQAVCGMDREFKQILGVVDDRVGYSDGFSLSARAASSRTSNTDPHVTTVNHKTFSVALPQAALE